MNMFKKNGGFTLVELIVVIAILAILAGIAVPAYSGYLKSAQEAGDITALTSLKTAAVASMATTGEVVDITVEATEGKITKVTVNTAYDFDKTEKTENNTTTEVDNEDTAHTVLFVDGDDANTNKDFVAYVGTMPTLKYFTAGAAWDATIEDTKDVDTLTDDQKKEWTEAFGEGAWGELAKFTALNTADTNTGDTNG